MARITPDDEIAIAEMQAAGATLQEIAKAFGVSKRTAWVHTYKNREIIRELKMSVFMHYLDKALSELEYLEFFVMDEIERGGEKDAKWITAELNIIRERNNLLDLPGFVREQRAKSGNMTKMVLHEDDAGMYAETEYAETETDP